jgi:hypothetical protein
MRVVVHLADEKSNNYYYDILWAMGDSLPEAESKEKHGVWNPLPKLTITSPYVQSRVDSNTPSSKRKVVKI